MTQIDCGSPPVTLSRGRGRRNNSNAPITTTARSNRHAAITSGGAVVKRTSGPAQLIAPTATSKTNPGGNGLTRVDGGEVFAPLSEMVCPCIIR